MSDGLTNVEMMVTTTDNPWDPFTQFDEWYAFDVRSGYNTCGYLARLARSSYELSEADQRVAINEAVEQIVKENILGIYKKVTRPVQPTP